MKEARLFRTINVIGKPEIAGALIEMGLFDFFRKSKTELSDEQEKWNKMWDLWAEKRADTPYAELMTYQSEINNGGHDQYFLNIENTGDLQKEMTALKTVLSEKLQKNLQDAYHAYRTVTDNESDEDAEAILEQCDDIFYQNEEEINRIPREYAAKIKL